MKRIALFCLILTLAAFGAAAQQADGKVVVQTFKFKFKSADKAAQMVRPLVSSEGSVSIQPGANTLVVTDRGDNVSRIADAIEDYDVPSRTFKLEMKLVSAGRVTGKPPAVPEDLREVAAKLSGVLRFNSFEKVGELSVAGREGDVVRRDLEGSYHADFTIGEYDPVTGTVQVSEFRLGRYEQTAAGKKELTEVLKTTLNLKVGQTVVLGASKLPESNRALMLIVVARQ
ncbi:MAG: secretin N-terminal domain-containing protein [Thermoanaerobaculia bacterium]